MVHEDVWLSVGTGQMQVALGLSAGSGRKPV